MLGKCVIIHHIKKKTQYVKEMAYLGQNLQVMPFEPLAFLLCHKAYFHGKI
jgi:hypothetical protein